MMGMRNFEVVKHFEGKSFRGLTELITWVLRYECIQERETEITNGETRCLLMKELSYNVSFV